MTPHILLPDDLTYTLAELSLLGVVTTAFSATVLASMGSWINVIAVAVVGFGNCLGVAVNSFARLEAMTPTPIWEDPL